MSQEGQLRRRDFLLGAFRMPKLNQGDPYKSLGARFVVNQSHALRVEVLTREELILQDTSMDIDDRMHRADSVITALGQPWGRGRSGGTWSRWYDDWQGIMAWWIDYVSQRQYYQTEPMVRVRDWVEIPEMEPHDDGTSELKLNATPVVRTVHLNTYGARKALDEEMRPALKKPPEWKTIEWLGFVPTKGSASFDFLDGLGYLPDVAEDAIKLQGGQLLTRAMKVMNLMWDDKDTTIQSVEAFFTNQQPTTGYKIDETSKMKPDATGRTGVHQT